MRSRARRDIRSEQRYGRGVIILLDFPASR